MLGGVVAVQQLEAHVLQPFLMGRLVSVHPLGVIVAIAIGVLVAGIAGALVAVPFVAAAERGRAAPLGHRQERARGRGGAARRRHLTRRTPLSDESPDPTRGPGSRAARGQCATTTSDSDFRCPVATAPRRGSRAASP